MRGMAHQTVPEFLAHCKHGLVSGPVALVFIEDAAEIGSTLARHLALGFACVAAFMPDAFTLPPDLAGRVRRVRHEASDLRFHTIVSRVAQALPQGTWLHYGFNTEYLFFPFCEDRSIGEMLCFHAEERRDAMLTYVIDLYAADLLQHPDAVDLDAPLMDRSGYYALARPDPARQDVPKERQLDFHGGLRWRFEEHVPAEKRRIDRIALFRSKQNLVLRPDHTFSDEEYNTYACPWHHNLTAAICSFRTAKALKRNPGSTFDIHTFQWHNSTRFEWHSRQLLDLGLMEPGQWF